MKMITVIMKPFKLDEVKNAMKEAEFGGFTAFQCTGFGGQKGHTELYKGHEYVVDLLPKVTIVVVVEDDETERVVECILKTAHTGRLGDGRIIVSPVEQYWNIRTKKKES